MRRFRNGATQRPVFKRPGIAYGQYCSGAPGPTRQIKPYGQYSYGPPRPTRDVEARTDMVPEMFIENSEQPLQQTYFIDNRQDSNNKVKIDSPELEKIKSKTIIDLREFH